MLPISMYFLKVLCKNLGLSSWIFRNSNEVLERNLYHFYFLNFKNNKFCSLSSLTTNDFYVAVDRSNSRKLDVRQSHQCRESFLALLSNALCSNISRCLVLKLIPFYIWISGPEMEQDEKLCFNFGPLPHHTVGIVEKKQYCLGLLFWYRLY